MISEPLTKSASSEARKQCSTRGVEGISLAATRNRAGALVDEVLPLVGAARVRGGDGRGADEADEHRVGADAVGCAFDRDLADQRVRGGLSGRVGRERGAGGPDRGDARDVHDGPAAGRA